MASRKDSIRYGDEYATNLVPIAPIPTEKPALYHSRHSLAVRREETENKYASKTMGKIRTTPPNPKQPMTKGKGINAKWASGKLAKRSTSKDPKCTHRFLRNPPVPTVKELRPNRPILSDCTDKIRANAVANIAAIPKLPKKIYVDTSHGHKNDLLSSGLVPRYRNKSEYGKVPEYIKRRRAETERAQQMYDEYFQEQVDANKLAQLTSDQREDLLVRLKSKWDKLYHQYQGLSVVTDTAPKKNRKEYLENEMSLLEKDINFLERHTTIFIDNV